MAITLKDLPWVNTLERLRTRIIYSAIIWLLFTLAAWLVTRPVMEYLVSMPGGPGELVFTTPPEAFTSRLKLAAVLGGAVSVPFVLWQLRAAFIPLLKPPDQRLSLWFILFASLLFYAGLAFAVFAVMPVALRFLLGFAGTELQPLIRAASYIQFVIFFCLPFAVVFQMPVIVFFLARIGILTAEAMRRSRRVAIFVIAVVAAILTPADVFSMILMAIPMLVLYELSILLAQWASRAGAPSSERQ